MPPKLITARATVNLHGLRAGETAEVDPDDPRIAALLRSESELLVIDDPIYAEPPAAEKPQEQQTEPDAPPVDQTPPRPRARRTASEDTTQT